MLPVLAVSLAALSAGLGQVAQARILAQPLHPITFLVEEGLPYGITQETVDAVAEDRALSFEPFTMLVVERELTWDESGDGDLPRDADVMLSVGIEKDDIDLFVTDATRASVAKLAKDDGGGTNYDAASDIRESFLNNLTQGQGPSAAVGAAMTAASRAFDGGTRSPVFWVSIAALPALLSLLLMALWVRHIARERSRRRVFSRARLELARVVLELDLLNVHVSIAGAELARGAKGRARNIAEDVGKQLNEDWSTIRTESLELAHEEQVLNRELLNPRAPIHERGAPDEPLDLSRFADRAAALRRRADALVAASTLRVGHGAGGTVLGQIALSTTLAIDDVLQRRDLLRDDEADVLTGQRSDLLALVREAETAFGAEDGADVIVRHADLMARWRRAERNLAATLARIERRIRRRVPREVSARGTDGSLLQRIQDRTLIATGGKMDTLQELRVSLDLTPRDTASPSELAERILLLADGLDEAEHGPGIRRKPRAAQRTADVTTLALVGLPLVAALIAGFVATSAAESSDATYGRTLVGEQPLASLELVGDPALLPPYTDPVAAERYPPNIETVSLGYVRERMASNADISDSALLPERLDLVVALLPMEDYFTVRAQESVEDRVVVDFLAMLDVYPRIKSAVAAASPATIDAATGEVRPGHAILPLWISDDGSYDVGLPLTGTLSTGVESRLGAYGFEATEFRMWNRPGEDSTIPAGSLVASRMTDLGREMEYNDLRLAGLPASALFWTVALATWTGAQVLAMAGWAVALLIHRNAGSRRARGDVRALREKLNTLAMGLDLSRLDAVAVLGSADGHQGDAAEADQALYETMLFTAWREVQALETLPRREQRGQEWLARVGRMRATITALAARETEVSERALTLIRSYS